MKRRLPCLAVLLAATAALLPAQESDAPKLLLAFASYRERPKHPHIFFYEHDGSAGGKQESNLRVVRGR